MISLSLFILFTCSFDLLKVSHQVFWDLRLGVADVLASPVRYYVSACTESKVAACKPNPTPHLRNGQPLPIAAQHPASSLT